MEDRQSQCESRSGKFFVPAKVPEDWKPLLAKPNRHWKTGRSAKTLAYCWQSANGFPESVKNVFKKSGIRLFQEIELLLAFPEYKVYLPPSDEHPSQSDIFVLAKGHDKLISITVEGKVSESFDVTIDRWMIRDSRSGKPERLRFLLNELHLNESQINPIRYQLLHRTASALIEAKRFKAQNALMLVHSFKRDDDSGQVEEQFNDYCRFLALFGLERVSPDSLVFARKIDGIDLYFSWVRGEKEYLDK